MINPTLCRCRRPPIITRDALSGRPQVRCVCGVPAVTEGDANYAVVVWNRARQAERKDQGPAITRPEQLFTPQGGPR